MANRIEVALKPHLPDVLGERLARRLRQHLGMDLKQVRIIDVYTVDHQGELSHEVLEGAAREALSDPVLQIASVDRPLARDCDWVLEVGFRPGVTDNVGRTAREAIELLHGRSTERRLSVFSSKQYLLSGELPRDVD